MKLGAITNGISNDFETALKIMNEDGLQYADLQFIWGKEICEHTEQENSEIRRLLKTHNIKPVCITRHNFSALNVMDIDISSRTYLNKMDYFRKSLELAAYFGADMVRTLSFAKVPVLWGTNGADKWYASGNRAWSQMLRLFEKPVQMVEDMDITLVVETGIFSMINTAYYANKAIKELGSKNFKVLWDPANAFYSGEIPYPDGYEQIKDIVAHVHIKDHIVDRVKAAVYNCGLGDGQMAPYLRSIANALRKEKYDGVVSYESVYIAEGEVTELRGYKESVSLFKEIFT